MKKGLIHRNCEVCGIEFTTHHPRQRYHDYRCAYIGAKLNSVAGRRMDRDEAITCYGAMYDDALRSYGRTKHRPMLEKIYKFCRENNTLFFTCHDIEVDGERLHQALGACSRNVANTVRKTGCMRTPQNGGKKIAEWMFLLPGALDGVAQEGSHTHIEQTHTEHIYPDAIAMLRFLGVEYSGDQVKRRILERLQAMDDATLRELAATDQIWGAPPK